MFLYDQKDKAFEVYEFNANKDDLINYRILQMKTIPENERIFLAETHVDPYNELLLFENYTKIPHNSKTLLAEYADNEDRKNSIDNAYHRYHVLKTDNMCQKDNEILLNLYYNGQLADKNVVQIQYLKMIKYFLLSDNDYNYLGFDNSGKNYRMKNIIQLPESLYILQLLEQERFTILDGKNISNLLKLFKLAKINELSFEELQKMDSCGITQKAYLKAFNKAHNDEYLLNLIKKG